MHKYCDDENYGFEYMALVRKSDGKEVYSCANFKRDDCDDVIDYDKVMKAFEFYIGRINSGIEQQLNSPKMTEEQKKELKISKKEDYLMQMRVCMPIGYPTKILWTSEYSKLH